jgi:hypothetical protein
LEKAFVLPLKTIAPLDHVPVPVMVLDWPDLSFHTVTALVEFMLELSAPSSHSEHPGTSVGEKDRLNGSVP